MKLAILILAINIGFLLGNEDGLINHWEFNDSLNDSAGDANLKDGVNYKFVKDRFGTKQSAVQLNNGYLVVPPGVYFHNDFTVKAWFNLNAKGLYPRIIDFGNGAGRNNVILCFQSSTSKIHAELHENLASLGMGATQEINMNSWYHIAFSVSGRVGTIYIDGKATSGFTLSGDAKNLQRNYNYIGKSNWAADSLAVAIYDDIRIYNRALCAAEILELKNY